MFSENGFLIGPKAIKSKTELKKIILHELHRLNTSNSTHCGSKPTGRALV